jgi:uncharacterized protein
MIHLLDINVLIALVDRDHPHNTAATAFFKQAMIGGWATCPLTENGFCRVLGHPQYTGGPGSPEEARKLLAAYCAAPGHQFWPDDISLTDAATYPNLPPSKHLTDFYLLALAVKRGARLCSFDRRLDPVLVPGGAKACHILKG